MYVLQVMSAGFQTGPYESVRTELVDFSEAAAIRNANVRFGLLVGAEIAVCLSRQSETPKSCPRA